MLERAYPTDDPEDPDGGMTGRVALCEEAVRARQPAQDRRDPRPDRNPPALGLAAAEVYASWATAGAGHFTHGAGKPPARSPATRGLVIAGLRFCFDRSRARTLLGNVVEVLVFGANHSQMAAELRGGAYADTALKNQSHSSRISAEFW